MNLLNIEENNFDNLFDIKINKNDSNNNKIKYVIAKKGTNNNESITFTLSPLLVNDIEMIVENNKEQNKKIKIFKFTTDTIITTDEKKNNNNNGNTNFNNNKIILEKILELEKWYVGKIWDQDFPLWKEQQEAITQEIVEEIEIMEPKGTSKTDFQKQRRKRFVNRAEKNVQRKRMVGIDNENNGKAFLQFAIKKEFIIIDKLLQEKTLDEIEEIKKGDLVTINFQCEDYHDIMNKFGMKLNVYTIKKIHNFLNIDDDEKNQKNNKRKFQMLEIIEENKDDDDDNQDKIILAIKKIKKYFDENEEKIIHLINNKFDILQESINQLKFKMDTFQQENDKLRTKINQIKTIFETE